MQNTLAINVKLDNGAYMPERAHEADAGYDLRSPVDVTIPAKGAAVIDTGVHIAIPKGFCGKLESKSGLNVVHGLISTGLIDSGYTGAIKVPLHNLSSSDYIVKKGHKVSQLVIMPILTPRLILAGELDETERGNNGFGSTGL